MFALIDVNNFYTSCETLFRPDLRGVPVVVLSNNDGCVISRSQEAKALGIKMAAPYFMMKKAFPNIQIAVFSSNYALYADMSHRVMSTLSEWAPALEIYSIDEAFMDLAGVSNATPLLLLGQQIRQKVLKDVGLTVGVGIAQTKTLAKLANHAAKTWSKTGGVVDLSNADRQRKLLSVVAVNDVWGVGRRIGKKLNQMGIDTALRLAESSTWLIRKHFNVVLERTVRELRGEPCLELDEFAPTKQQIVCSRSFGYRITDYNDMHEAICAYAERAAEKLRQERQYCCQISVFLRTSPHADGEVFYSNQASGRVSIPTQDTRDIIHIATQALDRIWTTGHRYMKAGLMLSDFYSQGTAQLTLFDTHPPHANSSALMHVMDKLNTSGKGAVWFAGQGIQQPWAMKREMLSPAYTTRFTDLPRAT